MVPSSTNITKQQRVAQERKFPAMPQQRSSELHMNQEEWRTTKYQKSQESWMVTGATITLNLNLNWVIAFQSSWNNWKNKEISEVK